MRGADTSSGGAEIACPGSARNARPGAARAEPDAAETNVVVCTRLPRVYEGGPEPDAVRGAVAPPRVRRAAGAASLSTLARRLLRAWRESVGTKGGGQNNKNKGTRRLQLTRSAPGLTSAVVAHRAPKHVHGNAALSALPRFSPAQFSAMHLECS